MNGVNSTVLCRKASAICLIPSYPIWLLERLSIVRVYVEKVKMWMRDITRKKSSPPDFVQQHLDVYSLGFQFYSMRVRVWWVSVWKGEDVSYEIYDRKRFTLLFCKASATYWTPLSPILFHERLSRVSAWIENWRCKQELLKEEHVYSIIW